MPLINIVITLFVLLLAVVVFAWWAGGRIERKFSVLGRRDEIKYQERIGVYHEADPGQFLWRILKLTDLFITEEEVLIRGRNKVVTYFAWQLGVSNIVAISNIKAEAVGNSKIVIQFTDEGGFHHALRFSTENPDVVLKLITLPSNKE